MQGFKCQNVNNLYEQFLDVSCSIALFQPLGFPLFVRNLLVTVLNPTITDLLDSYHV